MRNPVPISVQIVLLKEPPLVRIDLSGQEEESRGGTGDRLHWILMLLSRLTQVLEHFISKYKQAVK